MTGLTEPEIWIDPFLAELRRITHDDLLRGVYDHVVGDGLGLDDEESREVGLELVRHELAQYDAGTRALRLTAPGVARAVRT